MRTTSKFVLAAAFAVLAAPTARAQKPDFSGNWKLNEKLSQNPFEKIHLVLGDAQLQGAGTRAYNSVSSSALLRDTDRADTLRALMDFAEVLDVMEIEQSADEIKIWVGDGNEFFSLFYLDGEKHARQLPAGLRLEASADWVGDSIHIYQSGENGATIKQIYSRHGKEQLAFVFQLESKLSEKPVQFRLVYDPATEN